MYLIKCVSAFIKEESACRLLLQILCKSMYIGITIGELYSQQGAGRLHHSRQRRVTTSQYSFVIVPSSRYPY